jgi:acetyl esterase/lipase
MNRPTFPIGVLVFGLLAPLAAAAQPAPVPPQPLTVEGAAAHVYKSIGGVDLRLHVFAPAAAASGARHPAIVFFFGGGFTQGTINQFVPQAKHFAGRGMVAIVADYRVKGRHGTSPVEAMADGRSANRWVRAQAAKLAVDPARVVGSGGSAGGRVAFEAAVIDAPAEAGEDGKVSAKPDALVLFNPPVGRTSSPAALPPTLIMHGTADATVPYSDVERFCKDAAARMLACTLVGYEGATHGFFNPQNAEGKWYRATLAEADRFLTDQGYLARTP